MTTGHAFMNTLGAAVAEIKEIVKADSFLQDADKLTNISSAQKALLENVGATFAAANFFANEDIAGVFQISLKGANIAQAGPGETLNTSVEDSVSDDAIPNSNLSSICCLQWQWNQTLKKLVCIKFC